MLNRVMLIGNLCADPAVSYTPSGTTVANFNVATNRKWKDKDGNQQEDVEFHRIVVWGKTADFCGNYMQKGSKAFIEGRLATRSWDDQQGVKKFTTEIIAQTVQNLTPRSESGGGFQEPPLPPEPFGGGDTGQVPF